MLLNTNTSTLIYSHKTTIIVVFFEIYFINFHTLYESVSEKKHDLMNILAYMISYFASSLFSLSYWSDIPDKCNNVSHNCW